MTTTMRQASGAVSDTAPLFERLPVMVDINYSVPPSDTFLHLIMEEIRERLNSHKKGLKYSVGLCWSHSDYRKQGSLEIEEIADHNQSLEGPAIRWFFERMRKDTYEAAVLTDWTTEGFDGAQFGDMVMITHVHGHVLNPYISVEAFASAINIGCVDYERGPGRILDPVWTREKAVVGGRGVARRVFAAIRSELQKVEAAAKKASNQIAKLT